MWLNKQDSKYALSPKYAKYPSVTQPSKYVRICLVIVLNISWVLNVPEF